MVTKASIRFRWIWASAMTAPTIAVRIPNPSSIACIRGPDRRPGRRRRCPTPGSRRTARVRSSPRRRARTPVSAPSRRRRAARSGRERPRLSLGNRRSAARTPISSPAISSTTEMTPVTVIARRPSQPPLQEPGEGHRAPLDNAASTTASNASPGSPYPTARHSTASACTVPASPGATTRCSESKRQHTHAQGISATWSTSAAARNQLIPAAPGAHQAPGPRQLMHQRRAGFHVDVHYDRVRRRGQQRGQHRLPSRPAIRARLPRHPPARCAARPAAPGDWTPYGRPARRPAPSRPPPAMAQPRACAGRRPGRSAPSCPAG
jgi:hypothetical protein